jgi:hypothetical protein
LRPEPGLVGCSVDPLGEALGASVLPDGFMVLFDGLLIVPVRLPVPAELPVVDPLEGEVVVTPPPIEAPPAVEPPADELPPVCASANVLDSPRAAVKAIVVNFMVSSSSVACRKTTHGRRLMFLFSTHDELRSRMERRRLTSSTSIDNQLKYVRADGRAKP